MLLVCSVLCSGTDIKSYIFERAARNQFKSFNLFVLQSYCEILQKRFYNNEILTLNEFLRLNCYALQYSQFVELQIRKFEKEFSIKCLVLWYFKIIYIVDLPNHVVKLFHWLKQITFLCFKSLSFIYQFDEVVHCKYQKKKYFQLCTFTFVNIEIVFCQ